MKFEQNVWYKYSGSIGENNFINKFSHDTGWTVVMACKNWDRETDTFKIRIIYAPYYNGKDNVWMDNNTTLPVSNFGRIEYFMFAWKSKYEYAEFLNIVNPS